MHDTITHITLNRVKRDFIDLWSKITMVSMTPDSLELAYESEAGSALHRSYYGAEATHLSKVDCFQPVKDHAHMLTVLGISATLQELLWETDTIWLGDNDQVIHIDADSKLRIVGGR